MIVVRSDSMSAAVRLMGLVSLTLSRSFMETKLPKSFNLRRAGGLACKARCRACVRPLSRCGAARLCFLAALAVELGEARLVLLRLRARWDLSLRTASLQPRDQVIAQDHKSAAGAHRGQL